MGGRGIWDGEALSNRWRCPVHNSAMMAELHAKRPQGEPQEAASEFRSSEPAQGFFFSVPEISDDRWLFPLGALPSAGRF
jgi:hypothetical protein